MADYKVYTANDAHLVCSPDGSWEMFCLGSRLDSGKKNAEVTSQQALALLVEREGFVTALPGNPSVGRQIFDTTNYFSNHFRHSPNQ